MKATRSRSHPAEYWNLEILNSVGVGEKLQHLQREKEAEQISLCFNKFFTFLLNLGYANELEVNQQGFF